MSARALPLLPLVAALACATGGPHGQLRVELTDAGPASPQEARLVEVVRDAAGAEGLACRPGTGVDLLRCAPATVGNRGYALAVALWRSGSGYAASIDQSIRLFGASSKVCAAQARIATRIGAELGAPAVHVDQRSDCK
jgi:hypothetical protein